MIVRCLYRLRQTSARLAALGLNLLFPPRCVNCNAELPEDLPENADGPRLCDNCLLLLGPVTWPCCPACGAFGVPAGECLWCRKATLRFDTVIPLGGYHQGMSTVVSRMKRPAHYPLALAMGRLFAERRGRQLADFRPDVIVPIPMFRTKRLWRGTNSPEIIAGCLGRYLDVQVKKVLTCRRNIPPQTDLSPSARFRNVRGAFVVRDPHHLGGARVLLVDDTLTTGATCSEAAKMLKRAGAKSVACAVIARAQGASTT